MKEPYISVGILSETEINFQFLSPYQWQENTVTGKQTACCVDGRIAWQGNTYEELLFAPMHPSTDGFELNDVTIGINFHWQRKEDQRFEGKLKLMVDNNRLVAINLIPIEAYLTSVISSEMSATASIELLKAHAVISRSWLLAQIRKERRNEKQPMATLQCSPDATEFIKWYDHEDHTLFDVCADDHCQRYQGITKASTKVVRQAIAETRGEVLTYGGAICDARYSKCCGGVLEEFSYCWEEKQHPYLVARRDTAKTLPTPHLHKKVEAETWIRTSPEAFCNTTDKQILGQVLNNYDQETIDFYRWQVCYEQQELAQLIHQRSGIDFGEIVDLVPVARGASGRLWKLKIVGTKRTLTIGKELEIRRTLSASHLYSSAFVVDKQEVGVDGVPQRFILTGAGWGHGVGLCQIGAAVMGEQGYNYRAILTHYYTDAQVTSLYQ